MNTSPNDVIIYDENKDAPIEYRLAVLSRLQDNVLKEQCSTYMGLQIDQNYFSDRMGMISFIMQIEGHSKEAMSSLLKGPNFEK
jgi:hypothetical protein